jgi:large subunit ribosomal protein L25
MQATLAAGTRQTRGKNEARRLRRTGRLPAVVYGKAPVESVALDVDPKAVMRILHSESGVNTLIELALDGGAADRVLVKEFQLDPISSDLLHVDFYRLAMDKALTVTVPVSLSGEAVGVKQQGGLLDFVTREIQVECMPAEIPEHIDIDVRELMIGDGVRVRDVAEGKSWTAVSDADTLLVHVTQAKTGAADEEEGEEGEAEAAEGDAGEPGESS